MNIYRSLSSQWAATLINVSLSFLLTIVLGRMLGVTDFGTYSYILSLAYIFSILQEGGYRTLITREATSLSSNFNHNHNHNYILQLAIGHVIFITSIGLMAIYILPLQYKIPLSISVICMGLISMYNYISAILKGNGNFTGDAIWQISIKLITVSSILISLLIASNIIAVFIGWFIGLAIVSLLPQAKLLVLPIFKVNTLVFKSCAAFLSIDIATALYFRSDIILLKHLQDNPEVVGQYASAYRLLEGVILATTPIAIVAFRMLRLKVADQIGYRSLLLKFIVFMIPASLFIVFIIYLIGKQIVQFTYGDSFSPAGEVLLLLSLSLIFILPNHILTQGAIALNKESFYAKTAIIAASLNIGLNIILIPEYGMSGAAWATIATEGLLCIVLLFGTFRWLGVSNEDWCRCT